MRRRTTHAVSWIVRRHEPGGAAVSFRIRPAGMTPARRPSVRMTREELLRRLDDWSGPAPPLVLRLARELAEDSAGGIAGCGPVSRELLDFLGLGDGIDDA